MVQASGNIGGYAFKHGGYRIGHMPPDMRKRWNGIDPRAYAINAPRFHRGAHYPADILRPPVPANGCRSLREAAKSPMAAAC
jgi:hypothetical protein